MSHRIRPCPYLAIYAFAALLALSSVPALAQYSGIDTCSCHSSTITGVLTTNHPDKVLSSSEVLTTDGTGESGTTCAPGTSIFDPCTSGYDTYVAPYMTFFNVDDVEWALGRHWKQRFLTQKVPTDGDASNGDAGNITILPADKYVVMGAQWNMAKQRWQNYHGPTVENNWFEQSRQWNTKCAGCHTTGFEPTDDSWIEQDRSGVQHGVTCEACHGPADAHRAGAFEGVKPAFPADFPGGTEGPPQSLEEAERRLEICGRCHGRGASAPGGTYGYPYKDDTNEQYVAGRVLADFYTQTTAPSSFWPEGSSKKHHQQYLDYLQSSHWNGPDFAEKVDCITCHDSHGNGTEKGELRLGGGNMLCQSCHTDKIGPDFLAHTGGGLMNDTVLDCNDCHMPYLAKTINEYDIKAHTFRIVPPANSLEPSYEGMPNSCTFSCHNPEGPGFTLSDTAAQAALYEIRFANGGSKTEIDNLLVDLVGGDMLVTWDASTDANHQAYRLYRGPMASNGVIAPGVWTDVSAEDLDGDTTNTSHTRPVTGPDLEFFVVVDEGGYVGDGPWGHYFR